MVEHRSALGSRGVCLAGVCLAVLCAGLLIGGCSGFGSEAPPLADSTLTVVLTDLHLAVARQQSSIPSPPSLRDSVLARHGVSDAELDRALAYYSRHPDAYEKIYNAVIDSLNATRQGFMRPR